MDEFIVEIQAKLDEAKSKGNINTDLTTIEKAIEKLKVQTEIDPNSVKNIANQLSKILNQKIVIDNIQIDANVGTKAGQNYGKQFSKGVLEGLKDNEAVLNTFKKSLENIGMGSKEIDKVAERVKNLNLQIESITQSISHQKGKKSGKDILSVGITGTDQMGQAIKLTEQYDKANGDLIKSIDAVSTSQKKADTATDNFIKKQKRMLSNKQNTINQITSNAFDKKASNPITSEESLDKLNAQTIKIKTAMDDLKNSTADTFDDAVLKVNEEISAFKILERELRNADNVSSKEKDFPAIKIDEGNKLDAFVQKMEQSGHYTDELKSKVDALRTDLSNIFDENSLTNYLKGLNSLENEFKKVDATAKTSEKTAKESNQLVENLAKSYQTIKNLEVKKESLDVSKDINKIAELDEQIMKAKQDFDSLFTQTSANNNFDISKWNERKTAIDATTKSQIEYNNAKKQDVLYSSVNKEIDNLNKLKSEWQKQGILVGDFKTKIEELEKQLSSVGNQNEFNGLKSQIETLKTEATHIEEIENIKSLSNGGIKNDYDTQLAKLEGQFRNFGLTEEQIIGKTSKVSSALEALKTRINQPFDENNYQEIISLNDKLQKELAESSNEYSKLQSSAKGYVSVHQRLTKANTIETWNQKNSNATKEAIANNEAYMASLRDLNVQMTKMEFQEISRGFKETENSMRGMNRLGVSLTNQFKEAAQGITQMLSISSAVMLVVSQTKDAISEIKELDDILTEISKTSDLTTKELKQLGAESYNTASKYGRSASDYLAGVQSMSQSGFYGEAGKGMAEQSLLAQSAGDMAQDIADKYVIATNAAYKFNGEASKINEVLDGQNSISNRNSVALKDMATAMSEAGTVASSYNVAIEDLSAMIGTMESVTKSGGSEVGNSIKSLLINLQNVTSDKIVDTLNAANASMTEFVNGTEKLRNPIDILRDLAKTFNQLDEDDPLRAEILTNVGQKYHATKLGALLQNMDMFDKMLVDYSEGSGSALEEANKSATNLTGTLNKLSNSWTELINSMINSDDLKSFVNLLNSIVQGATKLVSTLTPLGTLGVGAGLFSGIKNVGSLKMYRLNYFVLNMPTIIYVL